MAIENTTGIIESIDVPRTTGTVKADVNKTIYGYNDSNFPANANPLDNVTFDIDFIGRLPIIATNIKLVNVIDPDYPKDEPGQILINNDFTGDIEITTGQIYMVRGATISGNVTINGGKLILSSTQDGSKRSILKGGIDGKDNMRIIIYQSDIIGNIDLKNAAEFTVTNGNLNNIDIKKSQEISVKKTHIVGGIDGKDNMRVAISDTNVEGYVDLKKNSEMVTISKSRIVGGIDGKDNMKITVSDTSVSGDMELKNNTLSSVINCTINGDLILKDNTNCSSTNNTVGGENRGCI